MRKHIDLLGLFYLVAAGLSALVAASTFVLGLGALSIAWTGDRAPLAARLTAISFFVVALALAAWAGINAWAGRALARRSPWARLGTLVLAVLHLFVLPFGTALGVYSLWVLLHPEVRHLFEGERGP